MQLTEEQLQILHATDGSFRVLAAAGSGKTSTMAHFVKAEIHEKRSQPNEICFITFTRFAAQQIKNKVYNIVGPHARILCGTFHSTMWKLMSMANLHTQKSKFLYDLRMEEGVNQFLQNMRENNPKLITLLRQYKCLIVDEFQDLDEIQFEFVSLFKKIQPALRVIAIGDLAQNIYRFRGTSNEFLRTRLHTDVDPTLETFTLTTNFRSSKQILNFVNTIFVDEIKQDKILPMSAPLSASEGSKPEYFEFAVNPGNGFGEYEECVVKSLVPIIMDAKKESKSLALIFPVLKCQSFQLISALLRQYSRESGFAFDIHQIAKEDETCATVAFEYDPKEKKAPIQCSSFHSSKGLEWDIVALINVTESMYNTRTYEEDGEAHETEITNLFYVGITRAVERLLIFANANMGGRHRHFAKLGDRLEDVVQFTAWGTEMKEPGIPKLRPIGVKDLVRKFPQHPDLYQRVIKCSESIPYVSVNGNPMIREDVYSEMKMRNRELAFGTFIDWKLKQSLCKGECKSIQDCFSELWGHHTTHNWFHRTESVEDLSLRIAKLDIYFLNAEVKPRTDLVNYVIASRYLAMYTARLYGFVETYRYLYREIEDIIERIVGKKEKSLRDEYILSQMRDFYTKGYTSEIQAVYAPIQSYQGLPEDIDEFMEKNTELMELGIIECLASVGATSKTLQGDIPLESKSFILGEADMVTSESGGVLLEIKCSSSKDAVDLRDSGNCKNLMQLLSYVALGRHGTIPMYCHWAALINPLTGAWERYDMSEWSEKDSLEFMSCLEELRMRS